MPTGIEETIAALVAAAAAAAEFSAFTAPPDGNRIAQPVTDAAEFGADLCLPSAEDHEGGTEQSLDPGIAGSAQPTAPVTGDAPRLASSGRGVDLELEIVITGRPPAADSPGPPPSAMDAPPAPPPAESPPPAEPDPPDPPAATPPQDTGFRMPVLADWANDWQYAASIMPADVGGAQFGFTGEEFNQVTKQKVGDFLNAYVDDMMAADPEGAWSSPALDAAIVGTLSDIAIDVASIVVDPPFIIRGIMRLGSGSSRGVDEIEQGKIVVGSMKIVGEVASAVLIAVAPISPKPRIASASMYGPESLVNPTGVVHNVVKIESSAGNLASHAVKGGTEANPVAVAAEYKIPDLAMNIEKYTVVTRAVPEQGATAGLRAMNEAHAGSFEGVPGGIGPYGKLQEHCSTYAAMVSNEVGIPITGVFGPRITLLLFKYAPQLANPTFPFLVGGGGAANSNAAPNASP